MKKNLSLLVLSLAFVTAIPASALACGTELPNRPRATAPKPAPTPVVAQVIALPLAALGAVTRLAGIF